MTTFSKAFCHSLCIVAFLFISEGVQGQFEIRADTSKVDSVAIRFPDIKITTIIPRAIKRISPFVYLNKVRSLKKKPKKFVPTSFWTKNNNLGLNINEVAFVNWNAGGENSISILSNNSFERNYKFRYISWNNELRLRYGINLQQGRELRKTDDLIRLTSSFGYRTDTIVPWYYSAKVNLNTQFSNGYNYPNIDEPISRFMAPGYLFLGAGVTYQPDDKDLVVYLSPITQKATFVLDQNLANRGAFGVERGRKSFIELGFLVTHTWAKEVLKNVRMKHRLNVYADYLRSFGNIDIDWELDFVLKVNKYIKANIGTHIIYDDDVRFDEQLANDGTIIDPGIPRIQFKQLLGIGFTYDF